MAWLPIFLCCLCIIVAAVEQNPLTKDRPNIVFILTDDQDFEMGSVEHMPLLAKHIINEGTFYKRHYCSTAVCCPSRVTLWTGKYAHNTNVTDVFPPYGGYPKFISQGLNENYLPIWLQEAGYKTFYTGKLFNAHTVENYNKPFPAGWTSSDFLLDPYTYQYENATTQKNKEKPVSWKGYYSTDVIAEKAYGQLDEAIALNDPFFLTIAPIAPHSNVGTFDSNNDLEGLITEPIPAKRHRKLFPNAQVRRTQNFNPTEPGGASWIRRLPILGAAQISYNDKFFRARLQALQAVDDLIEGVITRLRNARILDNTFIVYSTDNGFHISQHRLPPGKECGFEEDIHIPLIIRGPGVPKGVETDAVTVHTDLAPTFLKLAGAPPRPDFDGTAIPLNSAELLAANDTRQEHVNVEFWGRAIPEGIYGFSVDDGKIQTFGRNNTYKALRIISPTHNLYYSVWCTNEHELYNLTADPYQIHNLYPASSPSTSSPKQPIMSLLYRLDALLLVLKSCKGDTCRYPWQALHPFRNVNSLVDALSPRYDAFYARLQENVKVEFQRCELGYLNEFEQPEWNNGLLEDRW